MNSININDYSYTKCYCEENIWQLCQKIKVGEDLKNYFVIFISNHIQKIPIWKQQNCTDENEFVLWDYHVILAFKRSTSVDSLIYDFDTNLSFPCLFTTYINQAIRDETNLKPIYHRYFRLIPAHLYVEFFASDRSHMLEEDGINYKSPAPLYPPIQTKECKNNLMHYIDMSVSKSMLNSGEPYNRELDMKAMNQDLYYFGEVYNLQNFINLFESSIYNA